jgi:hypothetical protein
MEIKKKREIQQILSNSYHGMSEEFLRTRIFVAPCLCDKKANKNYFFPMIWKKLRMASISENL